MKFEVKITKLGNRGIVNAIAVEDDRTATLDIPVLDYFSPSFFPWSASQSSQLQPSAEGSSSTTSKDLTGAFISPARFSDLISLFKINIITKLIPGLRKDGYSDEEVSTSESAPSGGGARPPSNRPPPGQPNPPQEPFMPPRPHVPPPIFGGQPGRSDLEPLGGMGGTTNPLRLPGTGGPQPLGGMFVGPEMFRPGAGFGRGGGNQPWGGDGFLPNVPPGARFDPIVPPGAGPGFLPPMGRGRGRGAGGVNPAGEPDFDEFPPPGRSDYDNMFM
ncbi:hypothetical protein BT69DRAFT_1286145 [Atractiella rhizophila]|nr:hypothetical protein BT69DRAFT_1286145 [Atractiella rhizophila]